MLKMRLVFSKTGSAIWLSHLDTMRTMTRAFSRAGIAIRHTEGYNPHPFLSIAHPLSVGVAGLRELADCELIKDDEQDIVERMNQKLPVGLRIVSVSEAEVPVSEAKFCDYRFTAEYDAFVDDSVEQLNRFFSSDAPLITQKKAKQGFKTIDLREYVTDIRFSAAEGLNNSDKIIGHARFVINDAPISPKYLTAVLPEGFEPDYCAYTRLSFLKQDGSLFA